MPKLRAPLERMPTKVTEVCRRTPSAFHPPGDQAVSYPHPMDDKTGFEEPPCEHCGGNRQACNFNYSTARCSEMERQFEGGRLGCQPSDAGKLPGRQLKNAGNSAIRNNLRNIFLVFCRNCVILQTALEDELCHSPCELPTRQRVHQCSEVCIGVIPSPRTGSRGAGGVSVGAEELQSSTARRHHCRRDGRAP